MKKGQFDFAWIFAIIIGGIILFLAIYGALQIGETQEFQSSSAVAKELTILTDPLQAGFADTVAGSISFNKEARIRNFCLDDSSFGRQEISVATSSSLGDGFTDFSVPISVTNKYIFSSDIVQGEDFVVISQSFDLPYKVADMLYIVSEDHCFQNIPSSIEDDLKGFGSEKFFFDDCSSVDAVNVCFGTGSSCDITVSSTDNYESGTVSKSGYSVSFAGNLLYAALFSNKGVYDCNAQRLLFRSEQLADIFSAKVDFMDARGCDVAIKPDLFVWAAVLNASTSGNFQALASNAKILDLKNSQGGCSVW